MSLLVGFFLTVSSGHYFKAVPSVPHYFYFEPTSQLEPGQSGKAGYHYEISQGSSLEDFSSPDDIPDSKPYDEENNSGTDDNFSFPDSPGPRYTSDQHLSTGPQWKPTQPPHQIRHRCL